MKKVFDFFLAVSVTLFCFCFDDSDYFGPYSSTNGSIYVKAYVKHDNLFPFICDSAVIIVTASDMIPFYQNIPVSGDSAIGLISGIAEGNDRQITVTVFDPTKLRWCSGFDTCDIIDSRTVYTTLKLKQQQPNVISNDTINGHRLTADEIWSGNCFLRGDIIIPDDVRLTVEAGSTIRIATSQLDWDSSIQALNKVEIHSNGEFIADGNYNSIISFIPDSISQGINFWWGIGSSGSKISLTYCHISSAQYGLFVFSGNKTAPRLENCNMFYVNVGLADFGPGNSYSRLTFSEVNNPITIHGKNKNVDISLCDFPQNSSVDVTSAGSSQSITIRSSNFYSKKFCNLYISQNSAESTATTITAIDCYNIFQAKDNESGMIFISRQASEQISDAGCGFSVQFPEIISISKSMYINTEEQIKLIRKEWETTIDLL